MEEELEETSYFFPSAYEQRLLPVIKKLNKFNNTIIPKSQVMKILFIELSKFGITSRSSLGDYYRNLRDLGVVKELGKQIIKNEEGHWENVMMVKINLKEIEDVEIFDNVIERDVYKCKKCGEEFKDRIKYILHKHECMYEEFTNE